MRNLMIIALLLAGFSTFAQPAKREGREHSPLKDMSAEQIATLRSKQLALDLDLTEAQREKVSELELQKASERKAHMEARKEGDEPKAAAGPEERFNRMNARLDRQLAYKNAMKNILSKEQYARWEDKHAQKGMRGHRHRKHERQEGRR